MHDGMPYDPSQGQGASEFPKIALFKVYISSATYRGSWQMTTNS